MTRLRPAVAGLRRRHGEASIIFGEIQVLMNPKVLKKCRRLPMHHSLLRERRGYGAPRAAYDTTEARSGAALILALPIKRDLPGYSLS